MDDKYLDTVQPYVGDMLALESHIEEAVEGHLREVKENEPVITRVVAAELREEWLTVDEQAVSLIARHDGPAEAAMAALYDRYCGSIYRLCRRMLGDAALAEDVTQEVFWRLWLHARSYEPGRVRFATWLMRIASNLAISELRRGARRPRPANSLDHDNEDRPAPEHELGDPSADVPEIVWLAEQRRLVSGGLTALPDVQRQAVELAYLGGLTHAEIATVQGAPLSTVKTRLALALPKLVTYVTAQGLTHEDALR